MLTALSIRDIVLIDRLDIILAEGLTVFTGETGAGKSILLDSLGLALGGRGDAALVRKGADKAVVTAQFDLDPSHAAFALLEENGIDADGELVIRRIQTLDGRSRATINDQPASINLLRQLGGLIAEIHGQHDDRALVEAANHRKLLDAYGGLEASAGEVRLAWQAWRSAHEALEEHRRKLAKAQAERDYLEHAAEELRRLGPEPDEEDDLADRRALMMNAEHFAGALEEAEQALSGDGTLIAALNAALRRLERRQAEAGGRLDAVVAALDRVVVEIGEADMAVAEAKRSFDYDPNELERIEERLFALRAAGRKHRVPVTQLGSLLATIEQNLSDLQAGEGHLGALSQSASQAEARFFDLARALSDARRAVAADLDAEVMAELSPLKLERARFLTDVACRPDAPGLHGLDRVEFKVAANPGSDPAPLMKVASGGELARFMLALKVVLAARASAPTLIFDEIDTGVGGAVADAIGQRLARMASRLQVLAVTHSPQVAAFADAHMLVAKSDEGEAAGPRVITRISSLDPAMRREEIARMLSGARVTDEARAQAQQLLTRAE
ncbi:DNA repair protein RecN [Rhodoligotrophos appendicifer]|uniref:DNA repair protein RecN n=1 Tax=Rhodoligotrophos appendicifer TaxID=987056 RepID=UPI00118562AD|nr:DNA repair protein RecN [Rhodoligotrophos appendicifer]